MATNIPNVSFPYISIKLATITLTWRGNAPDYFSSLSFEKYTNRANTGTINLTYAPGPNDDPNIVEKNLVWSKGEALLQYGQVNGYTRKQKCMIYDYSVTMDNGVLQYTLQVVSKSVVNNWVAATLVTLNKDQPKEDVLTYMKKTVEEKVLYNNARAYVFEAKDQDFELTKDVTIGTTVSPFNAIIEIASSLRCKGDTEDRYYYAIEVDDSFTGLGHVYLRKIDTKQIAAEYTFNWGTKDGDIISWSIDYQGSVALARARGEKVSGNMTTGINEATGRMYTYSGGVPSITTRIGDSPDLLAAVNDVDRTQSKFTEYADHCYTATLTVIGQPKTLTVGHSIIQVNPMINGHAHHSQGKYKVIGVTETVNSQGFQTTYKVYRLPSSTQGGSIYPAKNDERSQIYYDGAFHEYDDTDFFYKDAD